MSIFDIFSRNNSELKWTEDALMIIDMQAPYIPSERDLRRENINCNNYVFAQKKVINSIIKSVEENIDKWNDIILVEYSWCWKTLEEIRNRLKNYPNQAILKKNKDWLLFSTDKFKNRALKILQKIQESKIEISWVNTSACVKETAFSLDLHWYNCFVNSINTLNAKTWYFRWHDNFRRFNRIEYIKSTYSKHYHECFWIVDISKLLSIPDWQIDELYLWNLN